ncbi:MAG: NAD-dependent epimerase/dehydratase family protein, partial [Terracidiphilus sp.]
MLFVTGITGHSGTHFLRELMAHEYSGEIRCVVRSSSNTSLLDGCGLKIEKVVGDLNDQDFLNAAMRGVTTVLHISS